MNSTAPKMIVAAALVLQAQAGWAAALIDRTTEASAAPATPTAPAAQTVVSAAPSAVAASRLVIAADLQVAGWDSGIAAQSTPVPLVEAIARLLPPDAPGLPVTHIDPSVASVKVIWPAGSRRDALAAATPVGAQMRVTRAGVRVELAAAPVAAPVAAVAANNPAASPKIYNVTETDGTLRSAIARWSTDSGWKFRDDYWAVDKDIPVAAAAVFGADFRGSVIALLTTTDLTELPIKPCFYSNQVVRVVPRAERCDRTKE